MGDRGSALPTGSGTTARARRAGRGRHAPLVLGALLLALTTTLAPAGTPVARAATDGLTLATAATYTIAPARHVVQVALDITARNNKPNVTSGGIITKYFYEGGRVAIQPEATNVKATSGGVELTATTTPADGYLALEVRFRASLFYHQAAAIHVTFDLPGGAPRSKSDIRVGSAFATFVAWAFGDTGSVRVVVPAGFDAESNGSAATKTTSAGRTVFRATGITDIGSWYLVVNADRKSALTSDRIDLSGGEHIVIRAWPEDKKWRTEVSDLLTRGLPKLVEQTGLAWPVSGDLSIFEVHTPLLEGYAGIFLQGQDKIEISEDLDDLTIIHEASHAWFNSDLFDGRWIDEGLADTFAARTLDSMGIGGWEPGNVSPTDAPAVRLVDWVHPGRITDDATDAREQYGYDASWTVIRSMVVEIGGPAMQTVLNAAQAHQIAYVGAGAPETVSGDNDWRRLLDLVDEAGQSKRSDDLFRRWVVTDALAATLDERAAARDAYANLVGVSAGWKEPFYVRGPLSDWDFVTATSRIGEAHALLDQKLKIGATAGLLQLTPPADLQTAYEAARDSLDDADRIAGNELAAVNALWTATGAVAAPRAPLVALGLLGTTPEAALADARIAFSSSSPGAEAAATAVTALIDGAVEVGRARLRLAIAVVVALVVVLVLGIVLVRRRRRHGRRQAMAHPASSSTVATWHTSDNPAAGPSYATLADQSSRLPDPDPTSPEPEPGEPAEPGRAAGSDATASTDATATDATNASGPPPSARGDAS